ncbi:hypothetical protein OAK35_01625 [Crocinitomicaceae bacterium]|nr:hypothetical protein [Crocinitomicaceae bacterium]MDC0257421.1 hypothetical protein [Crocinitomicaceae bacterium]
MKRLEHFFDSLHAFFAGLHQRPLTKWLTVWGIAFFVLFLIVRIILVNSYAADIGGIENNVIYNVSKMLEGGALYEHPESGNFNITQYSPIYYQTLYGICKLSNLNSLQHVHTMYYLGRALSLLFNLMGGYFLLRLCIKEFSVHRNLALIAICLYFLNLSQIHFAARPDGLFNLIFIGILYCTLLYLKRDQLVYLIGASVLVAVSIFVKQNGIQFLILLPAFFLLTSRFKAAMISFGVMIIGSGLLFVLYQGVYGENFMLNVFGGLDNGTSLARMYYVFSHYFQRHSLIFIAGLLLSVQFFNRKQDAELRFISFALVGTFVFAFVTSSKVGSWVNYYNEFSIAVILLATVMISRKVAQEESKNSTWKKVGVVLVLFLSVLIPYNFTHKIFEVHANHFGTTTKAYEDGYEIATELEYILRDKYFFISFDPRIDCMLPERSVVPNKDLVPSQSSFDYAEVIKLQAHGQIRCIVIPNDIELPRDFMGFPLTDYGLDYENDSYSIYTLGKEYGWHR